MCEYSYICMPVIQLMKIIALLEKYPVTSPKYAVIPAVIIKGIISL